MSIVISIFNNKGGVGKTIISWNLADSIAREGKNVLLIDFDPQCNLSIAVLGEKKFISFIPTQNKPYGQSVRAFLQRFLQNMGGEEVFLHSGQKFTSKGVRLIAGDFWLNVYAEQLNVGNDLLSGNGIARFSVIDALIRKANKDFQPKFDYVLIDLPPSFGPLVRTALYSSNYFIVPCTSDNFSAYCVGLIGQMLPLFINDWKLGLSRFRQANPNIKDYDALGMPKFAGWVFNGFDVRSGKTVQADEVHKKRIERAIEDDLVKKLKKNKLSHLLARNIPAGYNIGGIEDMNVLVQNSVWQNVPVTQLEKVKQLTELRDKASWSENQLRQIFGLNVAFSDMAKNIINICI